MRKPHAVLFQRIPHGFAPYGRHAAPLLFQLFIHSAVNTQSSQCKEHRWFPSGIDLFRYVRLILFNAEIPGKSSMPDSIIKGNVF